MQNLIAVPIELTSTELSGQTFKLNPEEIYGFSRVELVDGQVVIQIDEYKVAEKTKQIAEMIKKEPLDAVFSYDGTRVVEFQPAVDGMELDTKYLAEEIKRVGTTDTKVKIIELPLKRTRPAITTESVNEYGIREVVGTGRSLFTGSAPGRVHNVALASKKLNGVLIAPDEIFSMHTAVGEIEKETGFQDAFVIKNGRTIPGVGGGVCQVSTTLFRAALNAGLPIVERRPHAYRVSYYEQDSPPGLDAAVYFPSADLKFKNDTGNYLLLQTKVDTKRMAAEFNLYGVKDGRVVEISKPVITGQVPPPPDLYVEDPNLERGKTVKDEYATWGATVTFSRKVLRNGEVIMDDVFKSSYRPWQAVFRVGTKDI
jgi:vancomycin resistance protein YoaR